MKRLGYLALLCSIIILSIAGCSENSELILANDSEVNHLEKYGGSLCYYEISGTVYVDANGDGIRNEGDETGIVNVTVMLTDGCETLLKATTDADGCYSFTRAPGTYTVFIDSVTAEDDFNEELAASFDPTGPISIAVSIGPDSEDNDFGFEPRVEEITQDLEEGDLVSDGETTKFWKKQLRAAINATRHDPMNPSDKFMKCKKVVYSAEEMAEFIAEIQALFLPVPYQFTEGNEFKEALQILKSQSKEPVVKLLKELLTAELNHVSGKGIVDGSDLQGVMLAWAESIAYEALTDEGLSSAYSRIMLGNGDLGSRVDQAVAFLVQLNGNIGGGSGGGG